jgi:HEAT repeat protein
MERQAHIDQLYAMSDDRQTIQSARALAGYTDDARVMDALCSAAIYTKSQRVREVLISVLKNNPAGACMRFAEDAQFSANSGRRKWALVNLSLMGCRQANDAVINGLKDADASVRRAAALSTGLYADKKTLRAQERYFENNRFGLTIAFIGEGLAALIDGRDEFSAALVALKDSTRAEQKLAVNGHPVAASENSKN